MTPRRMSCIVPRLGSRGLVWRGNHTAYSTGRERREGSASGPAQFDACVHVCWPACITNTVQYFFAQLGLALALVSADCMNPRLGVQLGNAASKHPPFNLWFQPGTAEHGLTARVSTLLLLGGRRHRRLTCQRQEAAAHSLYLSRIAVKASLPSHLPACLPA